MKTFLRAAALAIALAVVAACSGGGDTTTAPTVPVADSTVTADVDWAARTVTVTGVDGYDIDFCEGEAPILCVTRGGEWIGGIELLSFSGGTLLDDVDRWFADFVTSMGDDRRMGCDPAYEIEGDDLEPASFAAADGHRYGFTGRIDGRVVERVIGYAADIDGTTHLLTMNALADDGCLAREGELPVDAVDDLEPVLAALAGGSTNLPSS